MINKSTSSTDRTGEFGHRTRHDTQWFARQAERRAVAVAGRVDDDEEPLPGREFDVPHRIGAGCLGRDLEVA